MPQRDNVRLLLSSCALLLISVEDGQGGCDINGSLYNYCQVVGWTAWTSCSPPCRGGSPVRSIIVCCPHLLGSHLHVAKDCFSYCNISNTVISKGVGKIESMHFRVEKTIIMFYIYSVLVRFNKWELNPLKENNLVIIMLF